MKTFHGILAMYETSDLAAEALRRLRNAGYTQFEVYMPFSNEEIDALIPGKPTPIGWIMFIAGLIGGSSGYFMQWYAARDYAINVGGRPINSWPSFIPITFELTVLTAAMVGVTALFVLARLPRLDFPLNHSKHFLRASQDRFLVCVPPTEPRHDAVRTRDLLEEGAEAIEEVYA